MTDKHTDGQMAGFTLGREDDAARAARIELDRQGETSRPFDRSMQRSACSSVMLTRPRGARA